MYRRDTWIAALPWCVVACALSLFVALGPLSGVPHVTDEVAYTLQAKLFAAGMRTGPAADVPSMLDYPFWVGAPASYSPFPPGWPALLAVGEFVGAPWAVNPLLAGVIPLLVWNLARIWVNPRVAEVACAVASVCPQVLLLGGSRMAHVSVVVALGAAWVSVMRRREWSGWSWCASLSVAFVVLARPFDATLLGLPILCWAFWCGNAADRLRLVLVPGIAAAVLLLDNWSLTGDPLRFPMSVWLEQWFPGPPRLGCNRLGFGPDVGCVNGPNYGGHSLSKAIRIAGAALLRLDRLLVGWPGGLLLAVVGLLIARLWVPVLVLAVLVFGYGLYWSPGLAYGARFYAPMVLLLPIGLAFLVRGLPQKWALAGVVVVGLIGGARFIPELSDRYWCVGPEPVDALDQAGVSDALVLYASTGTQTRAWPLLGVDGLPCDAMLSIGGLLSRLDPSQTTGGLQPRYMLADPAQVPAYRRKFQPGVAAVVIRHDLEADSVEVTRLPALDALEPSE